ncbi:hypothetical protein WK39_03120 [Burkholderia cepacia]|uniref:phage tail assembly chaperone n=1 Tax=Burkholderia cepacia TaxID=292 RepID=UPI0007564880|nr:hypothetical protein [Burkholderia cepacia]KVS53283.1 hypothetical protein WK39_03120 [Burkholderia cepacia]KVS57747.1 hypothetical protein WK40_25570 [Burkholderia cepacia]CAG9268997.1 conserved hypothetical protein [Burkholderia cepacia]
MATEIELSGKRYQIGKLNAMQQFHVSRRIAPIIPPMLPVLMGLYSEIAKGGSAAADSGTAPDGVRNALKLVETISPVLQPFADALANLKDEDAEYVFGTCLSVVERQHMNGWAKVWSAQHRTSMFDDLGIDVMLPLVVRVIVANLGNFIGGLLTGQASSPAATAVG